MRVGLCQMTSSDDPGENLVSATQMIAEAAGRGATFILTPEVTNCLSASRTHQAQVLSTEQDDATLAGLQAQAARHRVWLLIGSLALKADDEDRFVNRSFLVAPDGAIQARYDKIHMFDVTLSETESYRESAAYRPGDRAVVTTVDDVPLGMTICYDLRFPYLFRGLAKSGARIMCVPSAFAVETGAAHWEVLLRARAIETGTFMLAPAQCGQHRASRGRARTTYGHSLVVDPWGRVLSDGGDMPGVQVVDLGLAAVDDARRKIPSLTHERDYIKAE